jgi:hypothetical protein
MTASSVPLNFPRNSKEKFALALHNILTLANPRNRRASALNRTQIDVIAILLRYFNMATVARVENPLRVAVPASPSLSDTSKLEQPDAPSASARQPYRTIPSI